MTTTAVLLAAEGGGSVPEWAAFLGVPVWLGGAAFLIWLWLTGKITRASDCDARVVAALAACENTKTAEHDQMEQTLAELRARLAAVIADRDAWRDAHGEEVQARRAAEDAAGKLMESGSLSLALLDALKDVLGRGAGT